MLASATVLGLVAGLTTGGRLGNVRKLRTAGSAAVAFLVCLVGLAGVLPATAYVATLGCLGAVAVPNRALTGALLIGA